MLEWDNTMWNNDYTIYLYIYEVYKDMRPTTQKARNLRQWQTKVVYVQRQKSDQSYIYIFSSECVCDTMQQWVVIC